MNLRPVAFFPIAMLASATLAAQAAAPAGPDQAMLTKGNNSFAVGLYSQLRGDPGNLFFSPASISTAFGMAYAGARGKTATEMAQTLHFTLPPDQLHPAMGALLASLNASHTGYQLSVADALWAEQNEKILPSYLNLTKTDYGAGFFSVDFEKHADKARYAINDWVAQRTQNKILNLLGPGTVTADTRLILTNAIYFKGTWAAQFDKAQTRDEDFYRSPSQTTQAPFMHLSGGFRYFNGGSFQALEIPYKGNELSMIVLLPNALDGLAALEGQLTDEPLDAWLAKMSYARKVNLALPRFTLTQQFTLNQTLGAMGMQSAFSPTAADFSGITGNRSLWISEVIHKAFVAVDEQGTEAAAATAIGMRALAMMSDSNPPIEFRADHPFLFLIRDTKSGSILFLGRVSDPTK
jgi:serine protease inhibitor